MKNKEIIEQLYLCMQILRRKGMDDKRLLNRILDRLIDGDTVDILHINRITADMLLDNEIISFETLTE